MTKGNEVVNDNSTSGDGEGEMKARGAWNGATPDYVGVKGSRDGRGGHGSKFL